MQIPQRGSLPFPVLPAKSASSAKIIPVDLWGNPGAGRWVGYCRQNTWHRVPVFYCLCLLSWWLWCPTDRKAKIRNTLFEKVFIAKKVQAGYLHLFDLFSEATGNELIIPTFSSRSFGTQIICSSYYWCRFYRDIHGPDQSLLLKALLPVSL